MIQININNQGGGMMPGGGMMHNPNVVPQPVRKDAGQFSIIIPFKKYLF